MSAPGVKVAFKIVKIFMSLKSAYILLFFSKIAKKKKKDFLIVLFEVC